ncbi:MAG: alpha/beta fold hydrolase [Myxococcota bacterium]
MRHRFATVDDVELHWAELGEPGTQPPLVLIHGMADSHLTWRRVAEPLARDRLVLMPDLPGFGLSGRPDASYALQWHAHIIARWLEHLELQSVDVVGHSFGGGVAQMLLLDCPERIRRMVLVASGGLGREVGFWLKFATFPYFVERFGQPFMSFGTRRSMERLHPHESEADVRALSEMNALRGTARAFSRTVRDVINFRGQTRHFLQRAREVEQLPPIAVLWGEGDALIPSTHGRALLERLEGAVFQSFADCGHYVHQERPQEFVRAVRSFLDAPTATPVTLRDAPSGPRGWMTTTGRAFDEVRGKTVHALARAASRLPLGARHQARDR